VPYVVPPVPALLFLLITARPEPAGLAAPPQGAPARVAAALSRGELILIYAGLCVSLCMERGGYIIHYLLVPKYFATPINGWEKFFDYYPDYYIPKDARLINQWFEAAPDGRIPGAPGAVPGLLGQLQRAAHRRGDVHRGFFRRQWAESERLTYPLLYLPIEITGGFRRSPPRRPSSKPPDVDRLWPGHGVQPAQHHPCLHPDRPGIRMSIPLDEKFTDPPCAT